jgi:hypothetical protein
MHTARSVFRVLIARPPANGMLAARESEDIRPVRWQLSNNSFILAASCRVNLWLWHSAVLVHALHRNGLPDEFKTLTKKLWN